jgi:hypothetical protein
VEVVDNAVAAAAGAHAICVLTEWDEVRRAAAASSLSEE